MNPSTSDMARHSATAFLAITISLSAFAFVLGMSWLDLGLWRSQEVPAAAVHLTAAMSAFALGVLISLRDRSAAGALTSAPVLALGALAIVSLLLSPAVPDPWLSVYGPLEHGIGGLWHLEAAIMVAGAIVVLASPYARFLVACLYVSTSAVIFLYAFPEALGVGTPMVFPEWVAMLAGAVTLTTALRSPKLLSLANAAGFALLAAGLAVSSNRTVIIALAAVAFFAAFRFFPFTRTLLASRSFRASAAVAVAVAGLVTMWAASPVIEALRLRDAVQTSGVASQRPVDQVSMMDGALGTLWSRSYMIRIIVDDVIASPAKLLRGNGWGSFGAVYETHAREVPGRMFVSPTSSSSRTYWDSHSKANFHSHNMAAEALNSAGLPGLVLWLAFLGFLAASSRAGLFVSVAVATISTFWFPLTHMTAAIAVMVAAGSARGRPSERLREWLAIFAAFPAAAAVSALALAAFLGFNLARIETAERSFEGVRVDRNPETCGAIKASVLPEEEANIYLYRVLVNRIMSSDSPAQALFDKTTNAILLSCTMRSHSLDKPRIRSLMESLDARNRLLSIGPVALGIIADDLISWGADVDMLLSVAPGRTDVIIPYIESLRLRKLPSAAIEAARYAGRVEEGDPVREYLLSFVAESEGNHARSIEHMRRALDLGYANLVPLNSVYVEKVLAK